MEQVDQSQKNDNFWMYVGGLIIAVIALVVIFKSTHNEAIPSDAYAETKQQIDRQIEATKKK